MPIPSSFQLALSSSSSLVRFCLYRSPAHRDLHSFPTRRSSDLDHGRRRDRKRRGVRLQLRNVPVHGQGAGPHGQDRKSTRLNSSHRCISYAVFCLKKKKKTDNQLAPTERQARHATSKHAATYLR